MSASKVRHMLKEVRRIERRVNEREWRFYACSGALRILVPALGAFDNNIHVSGFQAR
jgi:hypothetical protein